MAAADWQVSRAGSGHGSQHRPSRVNPQCRLLQEVIQQKQHTVLAQYHPAAATAPSAELCGQGNGKQICRCIILECGQGRTVGPAAAAAWRSAASAPASGKHVSSALPTAVAAAAAAAS